MDFINITVCLKVSKQDFGLFRLLLDENFSPLRQVVQVQAAYREKMMMIMMMTEQISQLCPLLTQKKNAIGFQAFPKRQRFHQPSRSSRLGARSVDYF